jgi:hypothetical protein
MKATRTLDAYDTATLERMLAKRILTEDGCWAWTGCHNTANGYGRVGYRGRTWYTHRLIWTLTRGAIPDQLVIDHLCRNRICFNPEHMEVVTRRINTLRGETIVADQVRRTACPKGHPYNEENTRRYGRARSCSECARQRESGAGKAFPCPECGRVIGTLRYGGLASHAKPLSREKCPGRWPEGVAA